MISYLGHSGKIVARANQLQSQGLFKLSWEPVGLNFPCWNRIPKNERYDNRGKEYGCQLFDFSQNEILYFKIQHGGRR